MGVLDKIDAATTGTATVKLILNKALDAEWRRLMGQLNEAAAKDAREGSLQASATRKVVEAMDEVRDQVADAEVAFRLEQLHWAKYPALLVKHPPRDGVALDQLQGFNYETFVPAVIKAAFTSATDTDGDTQTELPDEKWETLLASLSTVQANELFAAAKGLNTEKTSVPPSARSLLGSQDSGASLAQPSPGTSRRNASKGGSRRGSPKSSVTKKDASPVS